MDPDLHGNFWLDPYPRLNANLKHKIVELGVSRLIFTVDII
jgi:hypothetical protein